MSDHSFIGDMLPEADFRALKRQRAVKEYVAARLAILEEARAALERAKGFVESWGKKLGDWDVVDQNAINAITAVLAKIDALTPSPKE